MTVKVATLGRRTYSIRPSGALGAHARRELLKAWMRCEDHEARERPTVLEERAYLEDLRVITRLALVGAPDEVIDKAPREELLTIRSAYTAATVVDVQHRIAAAEAAVQQRES